MEDDQERPDRTGEVVAVDGLAVSSIVGESAALEASTLDTDDATLAAKAFPGHKALCSETFMYTSRENYPLPWLVREIAQNFVDGNRENSGSLDGVSAEEVATDESSTFTFTGNWPFESFNDLVSFGSGKLDPALRSAGGNGIGIKQSILRFMRDFAVKRFVIVGEGWEVEYTMKSKDEINTRLSALSSTHQAKHGVFMANVRRCENRGTCKYIVETANPQVQETLREFKNLGVCTENNHLQDMHFQNEHGSIKWLSVEEVEEEPGYGDPPDAPKKTKLVAQKGRLFVNGQIFRYQRWNGEQADAKDYWRGPGGITIQLKNIQYEMSIDRPPMEQWVLRRHVDNFVGTMSKDELTANIKASEYLWTKLKYQRGHYDTPFCFTVIESIVERLEHLNFSGDDYEEFFGGKKYLHADTELTETQVKDLEREGYTICPKFFGKLNMPKASVKLSSIQVAAGKKPDLHKALDALFKASSDTGLEVPYRELDQKSTPQQVAQRIRSRLGKLVKSIIVQEDRSSVRIVLNKKIDKNRLIDMQDPPGEADVVGNLIYEIRGLAHIGLMKGFLQDIFMAQGQYVSTFSTNGYDLYVRNNESPSDDTYIELMLRDEDFADFCSGITSGRSSANQQATQSIERSATLSRLERIWKFARTPVLITATVAAAALAAVLLLKPNPVPPITLTVTKRDLSEIIDRQNTVETRPPNIGVGSAGILDVEPSDYNPDQDHDFDVENFEIVKPTTSQIARLELLKEYLFLTTGYEVKGKLFVYRGTGAVGINRSGNIGMHENGLDSNFEEAVATFTHEAAHNIGTKGGHNLKFMTTLESLASQREDTLRGLLGFSGDRFDANAQKVLTAEARWNKLRFAQAASK